MILKLKDHFGLNAPFYISSICQFRILYNLSGTFFLLYIIFKTMAGQSAKKLRYNKLLSFQLTSIVLSFEISVDEADDVVEDGEEEPGQVEGRREQDHHVEPRGVYSSQQIIFFVHSYLGKCTKTGRNSYYLCYERSQRRDQMFGYTFLIKVVCDFYR